MTSCPRFSNPLQRFNVGSAGPVHFQLLKRWRIFIAQVHILHSPPTNRLYRNPYLSLRATEGSVAISLFSMYYEIASVVSLPRNDTSTQSPERGNYFIGKSYRSQP